MARTLAKSSAPSSGSFPGALEPEPRVKTPGGIGSTLIGAELKRGAESDRPVTLDVMHGNPARRLYARLGFESTGKDPDKEQMIWRAWGQSKPRPSRKRRSAPDDGN